MPDEREFRLNCRERTSLFLANLAEKSHGNVHLAVLFAQLRGDFLLPFSDAPIRRRIQGLARKPLQKGIRVAGFVSRLHIPIVRQRRQEINAISRPQRQ